MTELNKDFIWLIWVQNIKTLIITSFNIWADNADDALYELENMFYNTSTVGYHVENDGNITKIEAEDTFPKDFMRILKIQRFNLDELEKLWDIRREEGLFRYVNKKKFPEK